MKRTIISLLLLLALHDDARAQICYGGTCYLQQPKSSARLVMPVEPTVQVPHEAQCRIHVGDGTIGSGTLVSTTDSTGLVLTCSHLFDTSTSDILVEFPAGSRFGARLIDRDPANDLAAVLIRRPDVEPVAVDDREPEGVLTACGYGGDGRFQGVRGAIAGAAQAIDATFPSLKIRGAVRPGDSGGAVLDRAGRVVGVVWGCRDGETYLTCGQPLHEFLNRVIGKRASARGQSTNSPTDEATPTVDWHAWRDEIDARLAALDAKKQDRGNYLQAGDLNAYAKSSDVKTATAAAAEAQRAIEQMEQSSTSRIESLRTALFDHVEQRLGELNPGFFGGLSLGKMLVGALGLSGPLALSVIVASGLAGRRLKRRISTAQQSANPSRPIAVDTPPPAQQTVPESHYVPVERDDFARAHQWAREQVARKYPGATEILSTLESLIKQQLAGTSK
jgi:Trypsin-like peptidase domain